MNALGISRSVATVRYLAEFVRRSAGRLWSRPFLVGALLALGLLARLMQYLPERSLSHDEAALAVNLIERPFAGLLEPLEFDQGAPAGFLMVEKAFSGWRGTGEYALRFLPFLCGLLSLAVFAREAPEFVSRNAAVIALALFAISRGLVYYSTELKQYSSDVLIVLVLTSFALRTHRSDTWSWGRMVAWGLLGAGAVWFSHPAAFVLAGTGTVYLVDCLARRDWRRLGGFGLAGVLWLASFAACYVLFLSKLSQNTFLLSFWKSHFMPLPPHSAADLEWFVATCFDILNTPTGFIAHEISVAGVAAVALLIGCLTLWSERRSVLWMLLAPVPFTLLASGLHKYPFGDRLVLFLVPALLLIIAAGAERIWTRTRPHFPTLAAGFLAVLFLAPVMAAAGKMIDPGRSDQIKPMLEYLKDHRREGDSIYVFCMAYPAYRYYAAEYGLPFDATIVRGSTVGDWRNYLDDVDQFKGRERVWMLFVQNGTVAKLFQGELARVAIRREGIQEAGASVSLYDFSRTAASTASPPR
jgi:hypothetical protein